jgi:hypothetical protein
MIHGLEAPSDEHLQRMIDFVVAGLAGMADGCGDVGD